MGETKKSKVPESQAEMPATEEIREIDKQLAELSRLREDLKSNAADHLIAAGRRAAEQLAEIGLKYKFVKADRKARGPNKIHQEPMVPKPADTVDDGPEANVAA